MTWSGLSAFPVTPMDEDGVDLDAFAHLVDRLHRAGVDSIGVLGSTGSYPYLTRTERAQIIEVAVDAAGTTPVVAGVGALRTREVLALCEDAEAAGATGLLLAPVSYQPLTEGEVLGLYRDVTRAVSAPVCVYENPRTTGVTFSGDLLAQVGALEGVASVKVAPVPPDPAGAARRVSEVRSLLPGTVTVGVSGDPTAPVALTVGADAWYSVLAGLLPGPCLEITRAAVAGDTSTALAVSDRLTPLWDLFVTHGSLRVANAIATELGLAPTGALPRPLLPLDDAARAQVRSALTGALC